MARPINRIESFRSKADAFMSAFEDLQGEAQCIDYLGGPSFYRDELLKTDAEGTLISDITPANFTAAIAALAAIKALLEADSQLHGKSLARMRR